MKKIIAVFMALIFTYSVISPDLYAAIAQIPAVNYPKITSIGEPVVSYSNGRINAGAIFGDLSARKKIIINIQDLHCNPEVQRKIAAILGELDSKYGFSNLYCEGAYSDIDTGWINDIDADKRDAVLETLLNAGRLTGSEYYSIVSNKNKIIKGIENAQIHSGNMIRFGNILQKQQYYKRQIEQLDKELLLLQNKHFSFENKRFDKLLTSYKTGRISSNKYYSGLIKYIDKVNRKENKENSLYYIDLSAYPNIAKYIAINNTAKLLNLKKITSQLVRFIDELKAKLPYGVFAELSAKTQNFSNLTDFYAYMPALMRDYSIELDPSQTDLKLFFDHALKETELNFLDLVQEEKRVIEKIRLALSKSKSELEVSFASDFYSYFKDYLLASITADDHKYFAAQFDEFRNVWEKYTYESVLNNLNADFEEINEFYRSNFRRDEIFSEKIAQSPAGRDDIQKTGIASLKSAQLSDILKNSDISVIITGGFHSEGIKEILETKNISYLTITPNVSKISDSNSVYADLAKQQAKYFTKNSKIEANAIALAMGSADAKIEFKNNTAFVELNGEKLILPWDNNSKSFKFEETIVELSESGRPASVFTKTAIENIKTHVNSIRSLLSPTGNSEILLSIIENLAAAAVNSGYFNGYGLIWEIAKNPELQKTISAESGINLNILASFPDILQKLAAQKVSIKEAKKQFADSPLISAILNTPEFEKFASALATFSKAAAADIDSQELPSAILPKNQAKVRDMLQNGEKPLKIAWYVARTEFFESLNPFKFIKEHETKGAKTGAAIVSAVTYLPLLVFGIALAFAPFMLPLAMGLLAGSAALGVSLNLSVHIIIDRPYIANNDIGQYKIFEGKPIHEIITAVNGDATNLKALEKNRTQIKNYVERQFIGEEKGVTELISNALDAGREARVRIGTGQISIENEADDGISIQTVFESLINTANSTKKDKKAQIGRFGLGFFSSLNYLWEETDTLEIVSVRNNDSFKVVVGAKYDQAGEREFYIVSVNFISKEEALAMSSGLKSNGTAVNIKTGYLNRQDDLDKISGSVKENFSHSMKPVHLLTGDTSEVLSAGSTNYAQIDKNPNDELKILVKKSAENDNTLLRSDRPGNGKLVVTIKGVKFFELPVLGGNSFKEIIIKLPNDLNFSVSRDSITTDTILIDHVKKLIEETINSGMSLSDKMAVLNALYALCEKFEKQRKDFIKEAGIKEKAIELIESEIKKANEENRNLIVVTDEVETYEFFGNDNGGIAVLANPYLLDEYLYETDNITMPVDSSSPNQQTIIFFSINNDTVYLKPYSKKAFIGMYYYLKYYNVIHDRILLNGINGDWLKDDKIAGMLRGAAKEVNSLNFRIASNRDTNFYIENHISDMSLADAEKDKTLENYSAVKAYDLRKGKNIDSGSLIDFVQKKTGMKNKGQISVELRQVIYDLNQVEGVFAGELLKNAKKSGADEIDVSVNDKRAIVTIEDNGAGMDLNEIEDMLLFNLKTKSGHNSFGNGIFSIFKEDVKKAVIITSKNGQTYSVELVPSGNTIKYNIKEQEYLKQGTRVEIHMNEKNADYLSFNIKKHLGFLHKFKGNIKFNGKIFTDYIENQELAKPAKSEKEDLRVYDTPKKQSALIIGGVFVKNIGVDFLENTLNIAEGHPLYNALKWIIDNGIVIEIPERINLLIDKQDIQLSDDDKTMIIKHLFAAFMQLYMAKAQANGSPVIGIPYDWLHKRDWYQMGHNKKLTGFMGDYKFEKGYNFDEVKDVLILIRDTFVDQVPVNKILKDRTSNIGYDYLSDFVKNIYSLSLVNDNDATEKAEAFLNGIDIQEISEDELYDAIIRLRSEIMNLAVNRMLSAQERKAYNIDNMINAIGMSYLPKRDGLFLSWGIGDMGTIDYLVYIMKQIKLSLERAEEIEANEIGKSDSKVPKTAREKKQTKIIDDPVIEKAEELRFMNDVFRKIIDALCESYGYDQKINIKYTLNGKIDALAMAYRSEITVNLTSLLWFPSKEIIRSDRPDAAEDFFAKWISGYFGTLVHEVTHIIEGKDDDGTHNKAFSDLQRDIMGRFFQNPQVIKNLTGDLNSLREKYKDLQIRSHKEIVDSVYGEGAYHNEVEIPNETRSMFNKKFTSALLPKNQAKVMMMIEEGEKPLKIAWHVARIEFFESLNPFKFIKDHETKGAKTGAAIVSAVTYLPLLVFGIALAFAPFTLPLAMGLLAGSAALGVSLNLAVHTLVDHFYFFRTQEETQIEKAETAAAVLPDANDGADIGGFIKRYGTRGDTNITPIATNFAIAFASPKMKKYAKELQDLNNKLTESAGKQQQQALKSIIELRKRVMKNKPPISNEDETSFYQSFMLEIDNLIVQNFDLLSDGEKNGSFTGRQRQYFDIMYLANNNSQDELSALANDKSKDIRLRLFAVLQLKKMSYEGDLNEITEEVLETLQSKKIKIENDYDLKAVMTGVHLVLSHSVEDVPDLSKLHDEPSIYDQIAKAVIVNKWKGRGEREGKHRVKAQADEALIFTPDAIDGISVIAHELGHIYLNKLGYVSHGNETMETMHEFFAYVFENLANSLIGGDFLPFSKKLFDFKNEKTVGSHDAAENFLNNINSAFKLLKEKADERFLWKLTAETAAYFATNIFDSADSQSEMFKKFIAVFADKIETQNIGIAKRQVIDAFRISEDDLAGFETGLGKVDTEYGILDKLVENGSLQLTDDNKKTAALFTDAIIEDVLSSMRLSNNEEDVNNMVLGSIKITAKYQRLIDAAYAKLEDIGIKFKNKVPVLLIANDRNCFDLAVTEEYNMIWLSTMNFEGAADEESITKIIAVLLAHENKHIDDHFEDPDKERFKMEKDANDEQHNAMVKLGIESFGPEGSIKADDVRRLAKFFDILSKKQADGSLKAEAGKRASKDPSFYYAENYSKELGLDNLSKKFDIKCNFIAIYDINQSDKERTFWIYGYFEQVSKEDIALINIAYSENGKMVFIEPDEKFLKKILNVLRSLNPLNFVRNKFDALINFAHLIKKGAAKEITYHNAGNSLEKAVSDYGAAYEDENGNVYTNVYFTRELAGENEELLNIGWKINDKNVWIKDDKEQGRVIIYSQAQTEELIENFIKIISSDPKFQGDARTISRIKKASGADLSNVKPGIIIDHNATQNYGTYNKSGSLVVSADIVESENKEERLAKLIKLNGIRNSEAKGILKKLYMDADITKLEDLLEYLKAVYSAEGKYITVDFGIFDGVNDETVKKIVKLAKDNAIFLCAKENDPADTLSRKNYLIRELGFSGYVTVENGKMYRHDPIYSEKHEMGVIERYKSEDEFGKQLESSSKEYNMFKMSEFGQVVNGGNRSITGRVAALEMFKSAILKFYESKMYSPESVKSAGYNFSEPLNAYQAEHENMIHFADAVTQYNVAAAMEALNIDKDSAAYLYLRRIRQNIKDEEQRVLAQLEFLKALSAKALADIALKESGIDDGLANEDFEILLGEKLLERYLTYADTNDIPVEINDFIKSGEGTYNDLNKKIVEQAAKREAQSVNATINLILLSERKAKEIRIEKTQNFNSSAINSILTAA